MKKSIMGMGFFLIAALLYITRYIAAALLFTGLGANVPYQFTVVHWGRPLLIWSIVSLCAGILCFALDCKEGRRRLHEKIAQIKEKIAKKKNTNQER